MTMLIVIAADMRMSMMVLVTVVMPVHTSVVVIKMMMEMILMVIINTTMRLALMNSVFTMSILTVSSTAIVTRCHLGVARGRAEPLRRCNIMATSEVADSDFPDDGDDDGLHEVDFSSKSESEPPSHPTAIARVWDCLQLPTTTTTTQPGQYLRSAVQPARVFPNTSVPLSDDTWQIRASMLQNAEQQWTHTRRLPLPATQDAYVCGRHFRALNIVFIP